MYSKNFQKVTWVGGGVNTPGAPLTYFNDGGGGGREGPSDF